MEQRINLDRMEQAAELFGSFDGNMKQLEQRYGVALVFRDSELKITGEDPEAVDKAARVVKSLITLIGGGGDPHRPERALLHADGGGGRRRQGGPPGRGLHLHHQQGQAHQAQDRGQRTYCDNIRDNTITIGVGPAGTGKTYLAVAMAVKAFRAQEINRIILHPPRGGGRGETGLSARGPAAEGGPLPAAAVRCAVRHAGGRRPTSAMWSGGTSRWRLWPTCGAAPWTTASSS